MAKQEKVFRYNVCFECDKNTVCKYKDEGRDALKRFIDFQNTPELSKLSSIVNSDKTPFSIRLVCHEFMPKEY